MLAVESAVPEDIDGAILDGELGLASRASDVDVVGVEIVRYALFGGLELSVLADRARWLHADVPRLRGLV